MLIQNPDILATITHPIGYMTAILHQNQKMLEYLDMTKEDFERFFEQRRKAEKHNKAQTKRIRKQVKKIKKKYKKKNN